MDPIANFIIRLKNAGNAGLTTMSIPHSNINEAIAGVLLASGYIKSFEKKGKKVTKSLEIELAYEEGKPKVTGVERISKLSRRVYGKAKDIRPIRYGYGMSVLSTPKGILRDIDAKKAGVGGEVLFKIW